jgi:hypothetical protein
MGSNTFWGDLHRHSTALSLCLERYGAFYFLTSRVEDCIPEPHRRGHLCLLNVFSLE